MEVFSNGENVAVGKAASQSSTYRENPRFPAAKATDGTVDVRTEFTHTDHTVEKFGWLEINLPGTYPIDTVVIITIGVETHPIQMGAFAGCLILPYFCWIVIISDGLHLILLGILAVRFQYK